MTMTKSNYRQALNAAIKERTELKDKKNDIEKRIAELNQSIYTLTRLCGDPLNQFEGGESITGIIRNVMRTATEPMGSKDVRNALKELGFPIPGNNPQASVHAVMKRLQQQGEVVPVTASPVKWICKVKK